MKETKETEKGVLSASKQIHIRIGEIIESKGKAFSLRALADKLDINRETFRKMVAGERPITPSELLSICHELGITIERLKQQDIKSAANELEALLKSLDDRNRALELALAINQVSLGITEEFYSFYDLGRVYFDIQQYDEAEQAWMKAYDMARAIKEKYNSTDELLDVFKKFIVLFSITKVNLHRLENILEQVAGKFTTPEQMSAFYHAQAMMYHWRGDTLKAKEFMYEALHFSLESQNESSIGIAQHNVAEFEFKTKNYQESKFLLESAIDKLVLLGDDADVKYKVQKDYARTLMKLGENQKGISVIQRTLKLQHVGVDIKAKLNIILSNLTEDLSYAQSVLTMENVSNQSQELACRYLMDYYDKKNEATEFLRYYRKLVQISNKNTDVFHEEEF